MDRWGANRVLPSVCAWQTEGSEGRRRDEVQDWESVECCCSWSWMTTRNAGSTTEV